MDYKKAKTKNTSHSLTLLCFININNLSVFNIALIIAYVLLFKLSSIKYKIHTNMNKKSREISTVTV